MTFVTWIRSAALFGFLTVFSAALALAPQQVQAQSFNAPSEQELVDALTIDPIFGRLKREDPDAFYAYVRALQAEVFANATGPMTEEQLLQVSFSAGARLVAKKAQTASPDLLEDYARENAALIEMVFAEDNFYCATPVKMATSVADMMARDQELAYRIVALTARLVSDPSTTPQPSMSPVELNQLLAGPFLRMAQAETVALLRKYRPASTLDQDIATLERFMSGGVPPSGADTWAQCAVGVGFNVALLKLEPRETRLSAFRALTIIGAQQF